MTRIADGTTYSKEERTECLRKMQAASDAFYRAAASTGNHAFVEFTGIMNEYIKLCQEAHAQGIDFMSANTHTGSPLPIMGHHVNYLEEKLDCIYGPSLEAAKLTLRIGAPEVPQEPCTRRHDGDGGWYDIMED